MASIVFILLLLFSSTSVWGRIMQSRNVEPTEKNWMKFLRQSVDKWDSEIRDQPTKGEIAKRQSQVHVASPCPENFRLNDVSEGMCGRRCCETNRAKRIYHGTNAVRNEFPWHAALFKQHGSRWKLSCGGVLVSPNIVLTAAHCIDDLFNKNNVRWKLCDSTKLRVSIGEVDIGIDEAGTRNNSNGLHSVQSVVFHDYYENHTDNRMSYDVALLKLSRSSSKPFACRTASLALEPHVVDDYDGCYGIGHGRVNSDQRHDGSYSGSTTLRKIPVRFRSESFCKKKFRNAPTTENNREMNYYKYHICATSTAGNLIQCKFDSGSPVVCPVSRGQPCSAYFVAGIFSYMTGQDCASDGISMLANTHDGNEDFWSPWSPWKWAEYHINHGK